MSYSKAWVGGHPDCEGMFEVLTKDGNVLEAEWEMSGGGELGAWSQNCYRIKQTPHVYCVTEDVICIVQAWREKDAA